MEISAVFDHREVTNVTRDDIENLKKQALKSPLKRFRLCLHSDPESNLQQMIIVMHKDTLFSPHRHPSHKTESVHLIEGELNLFLFDNDGGVNQTMSLSMNNGCSSFIYRLEKGVWHLPLNVSEWVVFHEIYSGTYNKALDVEFATFSPSTDEPEKLRMYCNNLLQKIDRT